MAVERPHMIGSPGFSPSLKYEIRLVESFSSSQGLVDVPEHGRTKTCFEIFDELIPQLGVFQHVMKMIRDELCLAVFSKELTSAVNREGDSSVEEKDAPVHLSRVPYFTIALKWLNRRDEQLHALESRLAEVSKEACMDRKLRKEAESRGQTFKEQYESREKEIDDLQMHLESVRATLKKRTDELEHCIKEKEQKLCEKEFQICNMENELVASREAVDKLTPFKKTHDNLQMRFSEPRKALSEKGRTTITVSKKVQLQQSLRSAVHVQKQLQDMQNSLLNEYESLLLKHTAELADPGAVDVHMMLRAKQKDFRQSMSELANELSLLDTHIQQLQKQLQLVTGVNEREDPFLVLGNHTHPNNPLHPQEQVMNKYAVVACCSVDSGQTFLPLSDAQACLSCGAMTLICPHKQFASDMTIQLPPNTTHVKLSRPELLLSTLISEDSEEETQTQSSPSVRPPAADSLTPDFAVIWKLFHQRCPHTRGRPRELLKDQVLLVIEQFYAALLVQDKKLCSDELLGDVADHTFMDSFITFMTHRYGNMWDAVECAAYDLLVTVDKHCREHRHIQLFALLLAQELPAVTFRYALTLTDVAYSLPWRNARDFELLAKVLYPFLEEEKVEEAVVELSSFSRSAISAHSVLDYLLLLLMKGQEPLVSKMHTRLLNHQMRVPEAMSETEYLMALDQLAPSAPDRLRHHLFDQAVAMAAGEESVKEARGLFAQVTDLAYITAYLSVDPPTMQKRLEEVLERAVSLGQLPPRDSWPQQESPAVLGGINLVMSKASAVQFTETPSFGQRPARDPG